VVTTSQLLIETEGGSSPSLVGPRSVVTQPLAVLYPSHAGCQDRLHRKFDSFPPRLMGRPLVGTDGPPLAGTPVRIKAECNVGCTSLKCATTRHFPRRPLSRTRCQLAYIYTIKTAHRGSPRLVQWIRQAIPRWSPSSWCSLAPCLNYCPSGLELCLVSTVGTAARGSHVPTGNWMSRKATADTSSVSGLESTGAGSSRPSHREPGGKSVQLSAQGAART